MIMKAFDCKICRCWSIALISVCFLLDPADSVAQIRKALSIDGSLFANSENIAYQFSVNYNRLLTPWLGVSAGFMYVESPLDVPGWSNAEETSYYYLSDENVNHLNMVLATSFMCPLVHNVGIYVNGSFLFEPIPFDYISVEKEIISDQYQESETLGKFQSTRFSPGVFTEAGLFYDFNRAGPGFRLFVGFGYGWYDMHVAYRKTVIDGQRLSRFMPENNNYNRITIRLMGL